jgi:predicted Zn-ribbon and HTH transcriptional regulator
MDVLKFGLTTLNAIGNSGSDGKLKLNKVAPVESNDDEDMQILATRCKQCGVTFRWRSTPLTSIVERKRGERSSGWFSMLRGA